MAFPEERDESANRERLPSLDRIEFVVRFTCGALLGVFIALRFFLFYFFLHPLILLPVTVFLILCCGFGAARYGDRFWHAIFDR